MARIETVASGLDVSASSFQFAGDQGTDARNSKNENGLARRLRRSRKQVLDGIGRTQDGVTEPAITIDGGRDGRDTLAIVIAETTDFFVKCLRVRSRCHLNAVL
jgi:hypothetical protein